MIDESQDCCLEKSQITLFNRIFRSNFTNRVAWVFEQSKLIPAGARVLDVGAGTCRYRRFFDHCRYFAHDFAQLPEAHIGNAPYGKLDYVSDINSIPVDDQSFDVILCTEVFEHIPEPEKALKEFARILAPGGTLLLTAPLGSGVHQEPYYFYGGFSPYWYTKFLTEAGFQDVSIRKNGGFFLFYGQESQRFAAKVTQILRKRKECFFLFLPFILLLKVFFCRIIPLACFCVDKYDPDDTYTVGYHVIARKV